MSALGWVYFARSGDVVKVGWSQSPTRRVRAIATSAPAPVRLIGIVRGTRDDEAELHRRFADAHAHGEWFWFTPDIEGAITWLCDEGEQRTARTGERLRIWALAIADVFTLTQMTVPAPREDDGGAWMELSGSVRAAFRNLLRVYDQFEEKRAERLAVYGRYATSPVNPPRAPTQDEMSRFNQERARGREASTLRAIFDDEEQVAAGVAS